MTNDPSGIPWQLFLHQKNHFTYLLITQKHYLPFLYFNAHGSHCLAIFLLHLELLHHKLTSQALSFIVVFARHLSLILTRDENQLLWLTIILVGQNTTRITLCP